MRGRVRNVVIPLAVGSLLAAANLTPTLLPSAESRVEVDPATETLISDLDEILDDARLLGSQASVVVSDADTGEVIYDHDGANRLMPASNEKLFTAAAALDILGPDHTFETTVQTTARHVGHALLGDLYLRGGGDPTLLAEDYQALAEQIAASGIRTVTGRIVADDTHFDDVRLGPDWNWDDEPFYYAAQLSALTVGPDTDYDAGTVIVQVRPGADVGDPAVVTVVPETDHVSFDITATTTEPGTGRSLSIVRQHGTNTIRVSGRIATDGGVGSAWASVSEPTGYAADVFGRALEDAGVRVIRETGYGVTPDDARTIASHTSMTLGELMIPFMKLSNNGHAEVLVKEIGRQVSGTGSSSAGVAAVRAKLAEFGVDVTTLVQRDGSGLSRRNFVPSAEIAALLAGVRDEPWFDEFDTSLPVAGISERFVGGTLRSRMVGTPAQGNVRAKTGSLTAASALSGYVTTADGDELIFAIQFNNYLSSKPSDLEDRIAVRLASHSADGTVAGPQGLRSLDPPAVDLPDDVECSWVKAC